MWVTRLVAIAFLMYSFVSDFFHPKLLRSFNQRVLLRLFSPSNLALNGFAILGGLKLSIRVGFAIGEDVFGGHLHWNVVRFVRLCASSGSTNIFVSQPMDCKNMRTIFTYFSSYFYLSLAKVLMALHGSWVNP